MTDERQEPTGGVRRRARDLGIGIGDHPPGPHNAITDVPGVRVGHTTLAEGTELRTGVTVVLPTPTIGPDAPVPAGLAVGNGYGKFVGGTQLVELGALETPVALTGTLSAHRVADALLTWVLGRDPAALSVNPVVGECNDGYLSDIRARPVTEAHVLAALADAVTGPVPQGCVGAGTGTGALGFKAGIGSSSRRVTVAGAPVTLGVLVQANFGGTLRVGGHPVTPANVGVPGAQRPDRDGSCVIVVATDAGLDARQLGRLARRAVYGLGRVGASYAHGSGDYAVSFAVPRGGPPVADVDLSELFAATLDAVEEAVLDSLLLADTTTGRRGRVLHALPADRLAAVVR